MTIVIRRAEVYAESQPSKPCAEIYLTPGGADYSVTTVTGSNTQNQTAVSYEAAVVIAQAHADALDADDGKDTNLDLRFRVRELEALVAELRAGRGDVETVQ